MTTVAEFVALQLDIQDRIRSAAFTLQRLPDTDRRFLSAGSRCCWPTIIHDWQAYSTERARMPRITPTPAQIDNLDAVIQWIAFLAVHSEEEARVVWLCFGLGHKSKSAGKIRGCSRHTIIRVRKAGLERLAYHILGITRKVA